MVHYFELLYFGALPTEILHSFASEGRRLKAE